MERWGIAWELWSYRAAWWFSLSACVIVGASYLTISLCLDLPYTCHMIGYSLKSQYAELLA